MMGWEGEPGTEPGTVEGAWWSSTGKPAQMQNGRTSRAEFHSAFFLFFPNVLAYIGAQLFNNAVIISSGSQSDSVIYIHMHLFFSKFFPYLGCYLILSNTNTNIILSSFLCYTVGPCW